MVILTPIENESLQVHRDLRGYLNQILPQIWIERTRQEDDALIRWPPRSPDLTPCDFFFWGFDYRIDVCRIIKAGASVNYAKELDEFISFFSVTKFRIHCIVYLL
jgi:hypothetical protein